MTDGSVQENHQTSCSVTTEKAHHNSKSLYLSIFCNIVKGYIGSGISQNVPAATEGWFGCAFVCVRVCVCVCVFVFVSWGGLAYEQFHRLLYVIHLGTLLPLADTGLYNDTFHTIIGRFLPKVHNAYSTSEWQSHGSITAMPPVSAACGFHQCFQMSWI